MGRNEPTSHKEPGDGNDEMVGPSTSVSLFNSPNTSPSGRKKKQVQRTRVQCKATESSFICREHFTPNCFEVDSALASQFGTKKKKQRLTPGAIPTLFSRPSGAAVSASGQSSW